jgi:hypothetical protein
MHAGPWLRQVRILIRPVELVRLDRCIIFLYSLPLPRLIAHAIRPKIVIGGAALQIYAEIQDRRAAKSFAAGVRDGTVVECGFGLGDVAMIEVGAQEGGVVAMGWRVEEVA